ncbi:hypothetical protein [Bacteroides sp.]|uniref:hypothetical protein n=1 Tax=Bacteroides sp. TaxID=29523 RepID=UPI0025C07DF4|nr:hypothetical protein [Bacteroides sp.]
MIYEVNGNLRCSILFDGTAEARLSDILTVMDSHTFPKRESEGIVGGPGRLQKLVDEKKVRMECRNNREYYNASDVLRHAIVKSRRPRKFKKKPNEKVNNKRAIA